MGPSGAPHHWFPLWIHNSREDFSASSRIVQMAPLQWLTRKALTTHIYRFTMGSSSNCCTIPWPALHIFPFCIHWVPQSGLTKLYFKFQQDHLLCRLTMVGVQWLTSVLGTCPLVLICHPGLVNTSPLFIITWPCAAAQSYTVQVCRTDLGLVSQLCLRFAHCLLCLPTGPTENFCWGDFPFRWFSVHHHLPSIDNFKCLWQPKWGNFSFVDLLFRAFLLNDWSPPAIWK